MLSMEDVEQGISVTHRNTALRYSVVDAGDDFYSMRAFHREGDAIFTVSGPGGGVERLGIEKE